MLFGKHAKSRLRDLARQDLVSRQNAFSDIDVSFRETKQIYLSEVVDGTYKKERQQRQRDLRKNFWQKAVARTLLQCLMKDLVAVVESLGIDSTR